MTDLNKVRQQVVFAGVGFETHADGLSLSSESNAKSKGGGSEAKRKGGGTNTCHNAPSH